jgi:ribulose bisphosphate carboxylase small subunit
LTGNFTNPKITTDIKSALTTLTNQLVAQQKQRLLNQGTSALSNYITKSQKPADSSKTAVPVTKQEIKTKAVEEVKTKANDLLKGLFNKRKKATDTTKVN